MFRSIISNRSWPLLQQPVKGSARRFLASPSNTDDIFGELKTSDSDTSKNAATIFDIDELLANSPGLKASSGFSSKYDDYYLGNNIKDPREAARAINLYGPSSGRSVDVSYQNVGQAFKKLNSILKSNNIRGQWNTQKRYIRPAKFQKQKHRQWWRKHFKSGFTDLMSQISDARRRGY